MMARSRSANDLPFAMPEGTHAAGRIDGLCIGHRVTIDAPPELVWDFVADFEGWDAWNPLYPETRGVFEEGAVIAFGAAVGEGRLRRGKARVMRVQPDELVEFGTRMPGGLMELQRFVEVHEISPYRCEVVNGDIWGGPLGRLLLRRSAADLGRGLEAMNLALSDVARRKWRGHRG